MTEKLFTGTLNHNQNKTKTFLDLLVLCIDLFAFHHADQITSCNLMFSTTAEDELEGEVGVI